MSTFKKLRIGCLAALIAVVFCAGTGMVQGWGGWFSPSLPFRRQTEALLNGQIALATTPNALDRDFVWFHGKVQQVWGLGVPCWRLLFEWPARWFGVPGFPDRIAFAVALFLLVWLILRVFAVESNATGGCRQRPQLLAAVLLTVLFPPFITLCRVRFSVYEEAVAYGYLGSIALFAGTIALARRPELSLYIILCLGAGLLGFVRPTMAVYGAASVVIAWQISRRAGWTWSKSILGPLCSASGVSLLLLSNWQRFGSGLEFGHRMNLSATNGEFVFQFHNSFGGEPFWSAARELLGGLFFVSDLNGFDAFKDGVVPWQSATIRYRSFYQTTFDVTMLLATLWCWGVALVQLRSWIKTRSSSLENQTLFICASWSFMTVFPLFVFYLHFPWLCSRYLLDFAPAVAAAMLGCVNALAAKGGDRGGGKIVRVVVVVMLVIWWGMETGTAKLATRQETLRAPAAANLLHRALPSTKPLPSHYAAGEDLPQLYGLPFNGEGWQTNGQVRCVVTLFVDDLNQLSLDLAPDSPAGLSENECRAIRARIGLEYLTVETVRNIPQGKRLFFSMPKNAEYRHGVQIVFVAFATPDNYRRQDPPCQLLAADWNHAGSKAR